MKTIKKEISIGTGDMELHVNASIDGKEILNRKSDSLVGQFAKMLFGCMQPQAISMTRYKGVISPTSITNDGTGLIQVIVPNNSGITVTTGDTVVISGALGCTEANGTWIVNVTGSYSNTTFTLNGSSFVHTYTGGAIVSSYINDSSTIFNQLAFANNGILVGIGTVAVTISDSGLSSPIPNGSATGQLTYNSYTTSQDTNDSTSAQVTMTQTFTNNSGSSITVNEIGLQLCNSLLVARDIVSGGIIIAAGKTLTINYRIKTILATTGDTGGFLNSFMRILYTQIAQATRAVFDITNTNQTIIYNNLVNFMISGSGGNNLITRSTYYSSLTNDQIGIQVGSGSATVAMADYALQTKILHGKTSGKLLYHGSLVDNYSENAGTNATFDITRIFENKSGGDVVINEIGAYVGMAAMASTVIPQYAACILHNILATPITLPTTDILKVVYTIKVIA